MDCCQVENKRVKKCVRKDGRVFTLPRKFSKKKCILGPIRGFTMRSSCAPFTYCQSQIKKKKKSKKKSKLSNKSKYKARGGFSNRRNPRRKNMVGSELKMCSEDPVTGYYRDGYCDSGLEDYGKHLVCGKINSNFLKFSKSRNNDLSSVVKPGEKWCLCEDRWEEAYDHGIKVKVDTAATSNKTAPRIKNKIRISQSKKNKNKRKRS